MEANQRRYRRVQGTVATLENDSQVVPEISKQQLRRLLTERRTVIGPNGEEIRIPKHMAVNDIIKVIKSEYGLSTAEVAGILVALKSLASNPEFRGKVNRVVVSGIESPLKIERPGESSGVIKNDLSSDIVLESKLNDIETTIQTKVMDKTVKAEPRTYTYFDENEYRKRAAEINAITAERYRSERAKQRRADEERKAQNKDLEKQLNAHYAKQNAQTARNRKIGLGVAFLVGAMFVTGVINDIAVMAKQVAATNENKTPIGIHETLKDKLFNVTPAVIKALSKEVTPIVNYTENPEVLPTASIENQNTIEFVSKELKENTNLANALNKFSNSSQTPVKIGNISSYQDFEKLLASDSDELYTSGPAYFANFSRQVLHGMLKDKYGAEKVMATYEKKGENDQIYEFYIRYYKGNSSHERTPEGRVDMTRNSAGRLQTKEYHTLPYEVYEILAMIGEFSDYSNNQDGTTFDIEGYAVKFTNGDLEKAKAELKERMQYGTEAIRGLIKNRVRDEKVQSLRYSYER